MFAQGLVTLLLVAGVAWALWRLFAAPLLDGLTPPPSRAARLDERRREREQLEREVELASEIRRLEPRVAQLRERLERIEARPDAGRVRREDTREEE